MHTRPPSRIAWTLLLGALALMTLTAFEQGTTSSGKDVLVFFGTYTGEKSKGIYSARLDEASGALSQPQLAGETANPSFLALHPTRDFLYAVNEVGDYEGKPGGAVSAFAFDRGAGALKMLNRQPSGGAAPAHLVVDHAGRNVLVANYGGGSAAVLPIGADGTLKPASAFVQHTGGSVNPERQKAPHAHSITVDAGDRFAYVADLGLDKVMIYAFNSDKGTLVANDPPFAPVQPGAGPRHLAFHPKGRYAYVINEMLCTIAAFQSRVVWEG